MALIKVEALQGLSQLPVVRQLGLLVGLAASIALGVGIVLWSQTPSYSVLYGQLDHKSAGQVISTLQKSNIEYKLDEKTGAILVASSMVNKAKIQLAKEGLPGSQGKGMEFLEEPESFRRSKFTTIKRFIRAREVELSRIISSMRNVEYARVQLAITEPTPFIGRDSSKPKASVFVKLYAGRSLNNGQVKAMVNLVSSSVTRLDADSVTVTDQSGRLYTRRGGSGDDALSEKQFERKTRLESRYVSKIKDIVAAYAAEGQARISVDLDLNTTRTKQTRKRYNPDHPAVKSEQILEEKSKGAQLSGGKPGATSNQPPAGGTTSAANASVRASGNPEKSSKSTVRNYKLDETISYINSPGGQVKRMSIAIVIDDKRTVNDDGEATVTPRTRKELDQITELVKRAVGFNEKRGDSIQVTNTKFHIKPNPSPVPAAPLLEQPWVWNVAKQVVGALGVLILFFFVLRPVMKSLADKAVAAPALAAAPQAAALAGGQQAVLPNPETDNKNKEQQQYDEQLNFAKNMVGQDPGRVAQVVRNWVNTDGG